MTDLRDLYQEVILDHAKHPRHCHGMPEANRQAEGYNPLCGDRIQLFLKINEQEKIDAISFQGSGCAISIASASLLVDTLQDKTLEEAKVLFHIFHRALVEDDAAASLQLGKLKVLEGVKAYPIRVKCATLAWHTLLSALSQEMT